MVCMWFVCGNFDVFPKGVETFCTSPSIWLKLSTNTLRLLGTSKPFCRGERRRVSSVVEHSSANPKVLGLIPGLVSYWGHGL